MNSQKTFAWLLFALAIAFAPHALRAAPATTPVAPHKVGQEASETTRPPVTALTVMFPELAAQSPDAHRAHRHSVAFKTLITDVADGRLDNHSLLEASVVASRITNADVREEVTQRMTAAVTCLRDRLAETAETHERAAIIHAYLHDHLFTGQYRLSASDLGTVFESGDFNCVSATLLYCHLCTELNVECQLVAWRDHVACRVIGSRSTVAVETTCPDWFAPRAAIATDVSAIRSTPGFAKRQGSRRIVSEPQLLALIDYNRSVELLQAKQHLAAMRASHRALQFDPKSSASWSNFLAAVNNLALAQCRQGDHRSALDLLRRGRAVAPTFSAFDANDGYVRRQLREANLQRG